MVGLFLKKKSKFIFKKLAFDMRIAQRGKGEGNNNLMAQKGSEMSFIEMTGLKILMESIIPEKNNTKLPPHC